MKILIIEDQLELSNSIQAYLTNTDDKCDVARSSKEAILMIEDHSYDLFLLDIMLPDGNGMDILKVIKEEQSESGVIIISAKNALDDKIEGLELGADDYLTKPFHLSEMNARIKAIYRRRKFQGSTDIKFRDIAVNPETREVLIMGEAVELTGKEYDLLLYFISNKNRVLTKQSLANHLWGDNVDFLDSFDFVYQHIKNLRKKIVEKTESDYITTIYGLGYKLINE